MRVVVADDDRIVRYALRAALREGGHDSQEAADGAAAMERVRTEQPDALILDLCMPNVSGYEVLAWLRREPLDRPPAVIILSAFVADPEEFERHPHVVAVLQKPIYIEDLLKVMSRLERNPVAA